MIPLLQLALDTLSMEEAFAALQGGVAEAVDVIEAGTLLICAEGVQAVGQLRRRYPHKPLVADFKIADAGRALGKLILQQGPDYLTVSCAADNGTKLAVKQEAEGCGAKVQLELYGHWDLRDAAEWKGMGITQVIYHHSRDAAAGWTAADLQRVKALCDLGMEVTVTGCIGCDELELFGGLPIFAVICGRAIREAADPCAEVRRMKERMARLWG